MRIAGRERLEQFCRKHADARTWIEHWLADVETAVWATPLDLRNRYASASFLPEGVVIFNVKATRTAWRWPLRTALPPCRSDGRERTANTTSATGAVSDHGHPHHQDETAVPPLS